MKINNNNKSSNFVTVPQLKSPIVCNNTWKTFLMKVQGIFTAEIQVYAISLYAVMSSFEYVCVCVYVLCMGRA
jgi:hypothetical protein